MDKSAASRWRRNLYEKTGLPDNFTPEDCFLAAIQRNKHVGRHSFGRCVANACPVALQTAAVVLFYVSYVSLQRGLTSTDTVLGVAGCAATVGYLLSLFGRSVSAGVLLDDVRHFAVFFSFGFGLAPVLYRLTDTISTDTIHTASFLALFMHLLSHDYTQPASVSSSLYASDNAFSLNASLFAAVCLASRLGSSYEAFSLLTVSVVAFVLCPLLRMRLCKSGSGLVLPVTLIAAAAIVGVSAFVSLGLALAVAAVLLSVVVLAPALFVRWQDHKDTINGPWDEAVPNI